MTSSHWTSSPLETAPGCTLESRRSSSEILSPLQMHPLRKTSCLCILLLCCSCVSLKGLDVCKEMPR